MLGFSTVPNPPIPFPISLKQSNYNPKSQIPNFQALPFKSLTHKRPQKFTVYAEDQNNGKNGLKAEPERANGAGKNGRGEEKEDIGKENQRPRFNFRWVDLVLDPDPENIVAVGLAGVLTWASVQVLWQLFFISLAILVAALKYSFVAAILIFILITLL